MHPSRLLVLLPALCLGCALMPPDFPTNDQTEWTTSGGPDTSSVASDPSAPDVDANAAPTGTFGPRAVILPDGETTIGVPLGNDDGPGPTLVQPVTGGTPVLATPID